MLPQLLAERLAQPQGCSFGNVTTITIKGGKTIDGGPCLRARSIDVLRCLLAHAPVGCRSALDLGGPALQDGQVATVGDANPRSARSTYELHLIHPTTAARHSALIKDVLLDIVLKDMAGSVIFGTLTMEVSNQPTNRRRGPHDARDARCRAGSRRPGERGTRSTGRGGVREGMGNQTQRGDRR